jgi:4-hydroxy-tetrahydrodipicolinate synthase
MEKIEGISVALLTPFKKTGEIDYEALKEHCNFLIKKEVNSLYMLGTTGESFLMKPAERKEFARKVIEIVDGRIPVFMHVGDIPTTAAIDMVEFAKTIAVSGIGAITPFYYNMSQQELIKYYKDLSRAAGEELNLYLYNLPACTTNDMLPDTIVELAKINNIIGIKNSMDDMVRLSELIDRTPNNFDVVQGSDILLSSGLFYGAAGSVSGNANVFPEFFVRLYKAFQAGDLVKVKQIQKIINEAANVLKNGSNLAYFKTALAIRGLKTTYTRKPIIELEQEEVIKLKKGIKMIEEKYL